MANKLVINPNGKVLVWSKEDLMEFGNPREGLQFKMNGKWWEIIESTAFSDMCKIQELM